MLRNQTGPGSDYTVLVTVGSQMVKRAILYPASFNYYYITGPGIAVTILENQIEVPKG